MSYATTAQFKNFTKITTVDATRDTIIDSFITRAEKIINKYCNVQTFENTSTTTLFTDEWFLREWLYLPVTQCESITSIKLYEMDNDRALQDTFTSSQFYLDKKAAALKNQYGTIRSFEIEVVYTPNNGGVPADITQAAIEIALSIWNDSSHGTGLFGVRSKEVAEQTLTVYDNTVLPKTAKLILDSYKRWTF